MFKDNENTYGKTSSEKKKNLKDLFYDGDFDNYKKKKKVTQKRREKAAKIGITGLIIAICTFLYLPQVFSTNLTSWLFLNFGQHGVFSPEFKIWQPFTAMWLHGGFLHLAINMFVFWSFGSPLQKIWGTKKILFIYIISGIAGGLLMLIFSAVYPFTFGVGASGALCGLLGAFAILQPDSKVLLFFFIPVKIKPMVMWFGIISLVLMLTNSFGIPGLSNLGHSAHLGGLVIGYYIALYWKQKGNLYTTFI